MSGARFNVISSRRSPLHKLVIQKIKKAVPESKRSPEADPPSPAQQTAFEASAPSLPLAAPGFGGWLSRIVGRKTDGFTSIPPASVSKEKLADTTAPIATHNIDEYNWSGFSCPYCSASGFVSCAGGHLACDGTAKLRDGRRFHQCFCGHAGFITGTIKTLESKRLSVEAEVASPNPPGCGARAGQASRYGPSTPDARPAGEAMKLRGSRSVASRAASSAPNLGVAVTARQTACAIAAEYAGNR
jgi:hypothetical protein